MCFILSSTLPTNGFWSPVAIAVSGSAIAPFFTVGLLMTILSFSMVPPRVRQAGTAATLLLLGTVWHPFWGDDAFTLLGRAIEQAFHLAEQRFCVLPLIDT